jgi:hypothetical protein
MTKTELDSLCTELRKYSHQIRGSLATFMAISHRVGCQLTDEQVDELRNIVRLKIEDLKGISDRMRSSAKHIELRTGKFAA